MLSGLIKSSSGDALLHGYSILHDMQKIKALLGVCPQHDVLFPELTVYQTLLIFAALKDVPFFKAGGVVDQIIVEAGLEEKKNARTKTLSGGQKVCIRPTSWELVTRLMTTQKFIQLYIFNIISAQTFCRRCIYWW